MFPELITHTERHQLNQELRESMITSQYGKWCADGVSTRGTTAATEAGQGGFLASVTQTKLAFAAPMGFVLSLERRCCHTHECKNRYDVSAVGSGFDHGL